MHLLGLMGSPRLNGNSDILLDETLRGAASQGVLTEKLVLSHFNILPCLEIYACRKTGVCPIKDDFKKILNSILEAEAVVLSSPIFFYSLPSHTKAFVDRCQALWCTKYILKKHLPIRKERKGYFISIGATQGKRLFEGVRLTVKYFFDTLEILYLDELFIKGIDGKGDILTHPTALLDAFSLGIKIAQPLK